jgi:hypothetical protein
MAFGVVDFVEIRVVRNGFNPLLQRDDLIVTLYWGSRGMLPSRPLGRREAAQSRSRIGTADEKCNYSG